MEANVARAARSLTSAVALLVLVGMGCSSNGSGGSNHANPTGTTVASNAPLPLGANVVKVTTSMSFHATRDTLAPLPHAPSPVVTPTRAWQAYVSAGTWPECDGQHLDLFYGSYSDTKTLVDGTVQQVIKPVPAWIVRCRDALVQPFGIPQTGTDAVTTTVIAANPNDVYLVIDAKTAKVLIAWNESPTSP